MKDNLRQRLRQVFQSRRVLTALGGLLVSIIIVLVPALQNIEEELMTVIVSVLILILGGSTAYNQLRSTGHSASDEVDSLTAQSDSNDTDDECDNTDGSSIEIEVEIKKGVTYAERTRLP